MILPLREQLTMAGDIFGCHTTGEGSAIGNWWVEARGAAKHPTMHRTAPYSKELSHPNADSGEVEKLRSASTQHYVKWVFD